MSFKTALAVSICLLSIPTFAATKADEDARMAIRRTPLVRVVQQSYPSTVNLNAFFMKQGGMFMEVGAGTILTSNGYVLTNNHVAEVGGKLQADTPDGHKYTYRQVVLLPDSDLAIVKLESKEKFRPMPLGKSSDLKQGDPVIIIGNPVGHRSSVTTGVINFERRAWVGAGQQPDFLQVNTQVIGGNSGGALLNMKGEFVGVVSAGKMDCEGVGFAIPVDIARTVLIHHLQPERLSGFTVGAKVGSAGPARVESVAKDSPADKAGISTSDIITKVGDEVIDDAFRYHLSWLERKAGDVVHVEWMRGKKEMSADLTLTGAGGREPATVTHTANGLLYRAYPGVWTMLPNFKELTPANQGMTEVPMAVAGNFYALVFNGYVKVPADGLYTFYTNSDDGSQLFIGDEMVVNNDGVHGTMEQSGKVRLKAGLHEITVKYLQLNGGAELSVSWGGPGIQKQEIPPSAYFYNADAMK